MPEENQATAVGNVHRKFGEASRRGSRDMICTPTIRDVFHFTVRSPTTQPALGERSIVSMKQHSTWPTAASTPQTLLVASICGPPAAISCSYRDTGVPCSVVGYAAGLEESSTVCVVGVLGMTCADGVCLNQSGLVHCVDVNPTVNCTDDMDPRCAYYNCVCPLHFTG